MDIKALDREQLETVCSYLMGRAGLHPDWTPPWLESEDAEYVD